MLLDQFHLQGRVALVTGASRGLGQALAVGLAEAGAEPAQRTSLIDRVVANEVELAAWIATNLSLSVKPVIVTMILGSFQEV